ncbi:hypothetical protein [Nonomuraea basaltis]|uniref:hypothetical protein n=1 Tax=Nonomuraea basaltis TaxID=2495887 RepID=UPI00110C6A4A|nr:hypothetical protein [Nonomuraea basaltis]TMR92847.1 hypothetical protein EJK15_42595 [Nonomuraea basaltis]
MKILPPGFDITRDIPTVEEVADYIGTITADERQHPYETVPERRQPTWRGGPKLDPTTEDEYRFGWFGQADYDGHLGGGA